MLTRTWKLRWTRNPDAIVRFLENIIQASFTFTRTVFFKWIFFPFWVKVGFPLFLFSPFLSFQPKTFFWRQMNKQPRLISTKRMNVLSKGFEPNLNSLDKVGTVLGQGQFGPWIALYGTKGLNTFCAIRRDTSSKFATTIRYRFEESFSIHRLVIKID